MRLFRKKEPAVKYEYRVRCSDGNRISCHSFEDAKRCIWRHNLYYPDATQTIERRVEVAALPKGRYVTNYCSNPNIHIPGVDDDWEEVKHASS